jgi:hypothetical protein
MPELLLRVCPVCRSSYAGPPQSCPYAGVHYPILLAMMRRLRAAVAVRKPTP